MRKIFITVTLSFLSLLASAQSKQRATGDVNGDGKVDINDVTCLVQQLVKNQFEYITLYNGYTITATSSNTAFGTVTGGGTVASAAAVTLTATPKTGYKFDGWYKGETLLSTAATYTFTPTADIQIVGRFSLQQNTDNPTGNIDPGQDE